MAKAKKVLQLRGANRALPPRATLLHEQAADVIRNMIIEGELAPGSRLPELELCELLGISRTPLREAVKVLSSERLVQLLPNRGAIVTEIDIADVDDTVEAVAYIEAVAAQLACKKASDREIQDIVNLHAQMVSFAQGTGTRYFRANQQFHEAIVAAGHNRGLVDAHVRLNAHLKRLRFQRMSSQHFRGQFVQEHASVAEALTRRDGEAVFHAIIGHMRTVGTMIGTQPPEDAVPQETRASASS